MHPKKEREDNAKYGNGHSEGTAKPFGGSLPVNPRASPIVRDS